MPLDEDELDYLAILLAGAYYGDAANGRRGDCRHPETREPGCSGCEAFAWAERLTGTEPTRENTDWWTRRWRVRKF